MTKQIQQKFEESIKIAEDKRSYEHKQYNLIAILRIVYFVAAVVAIVYVGDKINIWLAILAGFILLTVFAFIIRYHQKIAWKRDYYSYLSKVNQEEIYRLNNEFKKNEFK